MSGSRAPAPGGASPEAIAHHYDIDPEFYGLWLDDLLTYSSALWHEGEDDLGRAQQAKLDYFLTRCDVGRGPLLDVGCGWGSLLIHAHRAHGVERSVGLTLSAEQAGFARRALPTSDIRVESWEDHTADEPYAAVISIGALEHFARPGLGRAGRTERYRAFFARVHALLRPRGRLGLQAIAFDQASEADDGPLAQFLRNEVFPQSMLPRLPELVAAAEPYFHLVELACRGRDYARTCMEWRRRLTRHRSEATDLVGEPTVERYLQYLTGARMGFMRGDWTLVRTVLVARQRPLSPMVD